MTTQAVASESMLTGTLRLTAPLADTFHIYGNPPTIARARQWATSHRLGLVEGVPACPHGLAAMVGCPGRCRDLADLDHASIWWQAPEPGRRGRLVLLAHPYATSMPAGASLLADGSGLTLDSDPADDWYHPGSTIPVRLTATDHPAVMWPLECRLIVLSSAAPIRWGTEGATR